MLQENVKHARNSRSIFQKMWASETSFKKYEAYFKKFEACL